MDTVELLHQDLGAIVGDWLKRGDDRFGALTLSDHPEAFPFRPGTVGQSDGRVAGGERYQVHVGKQIGD
jgi:hypothetical protein